MIRLAPSIALALALLLGSTAHADKKKPQIKEGFYISLGFGYASVSGTRGVLMVTADECTSKAGPEDTFLWVETNGFQNQCIIAPGNAAQKSEFFGEVVRTDYGGGAALQIRLGYTIRGFVTPELVVAGNGDLGTMKEGMGHLGFRLRYHPAQHWRPGADRPWDVGLYYGGGFSIGGYNHDDYGGVFDSGKGWIGDFHTTGLTAEYAATDTVAYGVDLSWIMPVYEGWIVNFGDDVISAPKEPPPTTVFAPILYLSFRP